MAKLYAPLLKVDEQDDGTCCISGIASSETADAAGEIVTAAAIKAALPDFMRLGTGALREMHQLSAAGTVDTAAVGDDDVTVIEATVVDAQAVRKCVLGVYKGLSVGGKVLERDPNNRKIITKIRLNEISLVDRPCNPDATFDLWKADGASRSTLGRIAPAVSVQSVRAVLAAMPDAERALVLIKAARTRPMRIGE